MINEYAVEPAAVNNWQNFRYIMDDVGVEHGRLISRFPAKWSRMVRDACRANALLRDNDRKKIMLKLDQLERKMVKSHRSYDPSKQWLANAEEQHQSAPFHAIIVQENKNNAPYAAAIDEIDESHSLWAAEKAKVVFRRAYDLAQCARMLLNISREILIIDPHFRSYEPRFLSTISHMLTYAFEEKHPVRVEIHVETKGQDQEWWRNSCQDDLSPFIPEGLNIAVFRWQAKSGGDKLHARYVMTEHGCIDYNYGLDEGENEGQKTNVAILPRSVYEQRWRDYQRETAAFDLVDEIVITGIKESL